MSDLVSRGAKALVSAFCQHPLGAATGAQVLEPVLLGALGEEARSVVYVCQERADFGAYGMSPRALEPSLTAALRVVLGEVISRQHTLVATRWIRFRRGGYSLAADDAYWIGEHLRNDTIETSIDLSADETGEADIVFTHGDAVFFTVPQRLGQLAVVRRTASIARYDRYLTHRVGEREVYRVRLLFAQR